MKKYLILLAFAFLMGSNTYAQSGIQFTQGTWKELLAKADKENKLIFMDAYAEWCGPCKMMARDVFTAEEVGKYFNAKFINVKMDMEKGEGIGLSSDFGIMAYPTLLFIDETGKVVHRAVGYQTTDLLLDLGEAALDPNRNISAINAKYEKGDRSPALLKNLAQARYDAMDGSYSQIAEEYLKTQKDWSSDENMEFIFQMTSDLDSKMADFMLANQKAFEAKFGDRAIAGKVNELVQNTISQAETEADLKKVEQLYAKIYPEQAEEMALRLKMGFYAQREDWSNFGKAADAFYKKFPAQSWDELNEIAWIYYEEVNGKKELKTALNWAKQSVKMEKNYYNMDTMASLYYKLGKKGKALKAAKEAITLAKATGEDYSATEGLIEKIKGR
jgi:thiol-disulfide isomerase/thioredoxin